MLASTDSIVEARICCLSFEFAVSAFKFQSTIYSLLRHWMFKATCSMLVAMQTES
jgi:hypothetical protein